MSEIAAIFLFVRSMMGKFISGDLFEELSNFRWSRLVPRGSITTYTRERGEKVDEVRFGYAFGVEFTWRPGPGIAVGVGMSDLWLGWPRSSR